jgi:hypothetical protein
MKKLLSIILLLFCFTTAFSHKSEISYNKNTILLKDKRNFNFNDIKDRFVNYLNLTQREKDDLFYIHKTFNDKMSKASIIEDDNKKSDAIFNAINYEIDNAKVVLDSAQYNKFIKIFTITLNNRGFFENISLKNIEKKS